MQDTELARARIVNHTGRSGGFTSQENEVMARPASNYPAELRERAVGMFTEIRKDHPSD